jgi:hypothetical protein
MKNYPLAGYYPSLSGAYRAPAGAPSPLLTRRDAIEQRRLAREIALAALG